MPCHLPRHFPLHSTRFPSSGHRTHHIRVKL
ncbi:hypothetical protein KP509_09G052700 [Ceratopteris richardii]|uniref:Uncharacterized protein n=1 Tax=Ceratopteris richardii TaxID=49495 RepID=A0A8T2UAG2_CERRI|nr:hypothetical protein KP509_09G052700 [Ceratopteris richardii]